MKFNQLLLSTSPHRIKIKSIYAGIWQTQMTYQPQMRRHKETKGDLDMLLIDVETILVNQETDINTESN